MDFITDFLFGLSSRTMVPPHLITKESADLMTAFNELQAAASTRIRIGSNWPLFEIFSDRMKHPKRVVDAYTMPIVQSALNEKRSSNILPGDDDSSTRSLLEYLVSRTDGKFPFSEPCNLSLPYAKDSTLIRDTLLAFLLAGRDTSASLLTFVTYALALYPDVYQRLEAEINETAGGDESISIDNVKHMRYLRAIINETLRLFPPVPFNIRRSTDVPSILPSLLSHIPGGLYMYPRCSVTFSPLHIHRRKDLWGDDAEEFKPERWLLENPTKVHVANPFAFIPFNGGPRMCLGQNLAYLLASQTIARMVRRYTWTLSPAHQPAMVPDKWKGEPGRKGVEQCWPKAALTLYSDRGLFVIVQKKGEAKAKAEQIGVHEKSATIFPYAFNQKTGRRQSPSSSLLV
ncbi:hypothetical protein FRC12_023236 [Ceratobasidium sp. 428]|nr:hypothetical protein FRC12_023236 [Ceratobasidium sp. 428]